VRIRPFLGLGLLFGVGLPAPAHGDPRVTLRPAAGPAGTAVTLRGDGFGRSKAVVVRRGRALLARVRSGRRGSFRVRLTLPRRARGTVRLSSRSRARRVVNRFRVSSGQQAGSASEQATSRGLRLRWSPNEGPAGARLRLRGAGFRPGRRVRARFAGAPPRRTRSNRRGRFALGLVAPPAASARRRTVVSVRSRRARLRFGFVVTGGGSAPGGPGPTVPGPGAPVVARSKPVFVIYYLWWSRDHWVNRLGPNYPFGQSPNPLPARLDSGGCNAVSLYSGNRLTDISQGLAYDQSNPAVIERDVRMAAAARIAGFAVNWNGTGSRSQTPTSTGDNKRLQWMFDAVHKVNAEGIPFKLQLNYKTASRPSATETINDLNYFVDRYGGDPALDHTYSSKPEMVWTGSWKYTDTEKTSVSKAVRSRLYLIGGDKHTWDANSAANFDGNSWYWPGQDPVGNPQSFSQVKAVASKVHSTRNPDGSSKVWLGPLAPGYNPVLLYGGDTCVPRNNGSTMKRLFQGNLASNPDGWLFVSWNEIAEASYIVPLTRYGDAYLGVLRSLIESGE
jgi:hypothetical protein